MASRAPLLVAAALFLVGVAGLLATLPGSDAGRAFLAPPRAAVPETHPVDSGALAMAPDVPQIPVRPVATVSDADAGGVVADATVADETPVPSPPPPPHGAVIAAVAADEPPTPPSLHPVLISADGDDEGSADAQTVTPTPSPTESPTATPTP